MIFIISAMNKIGIRKGANCGFKVGNHIKSPKNDKKRNDLYKNGVEMKIFECYNYCTKR